MIVYFCGVSGLKWMGPTAWQGTVCCVQGKVECSAVVSCSAVWSAGCAIHPYITVFHIIGF